MGGGSCCRAAPPRAPARKASNGWRRELDPDREAIGERRPAPPKFARSAREWWTRSQRIRTAAELTLTVSLVDRSSLPLHAQVAHRARALAALGLPNVRIAAELGVSDKTVAKALRTSQSGDPASPAVRWPCIRAPKRQAGSARCTQISHGPPRNSVVAAPRCVQAAAENGIEPLSKKAMGIVDPGHDPDL